MDSSRQRGGYAQLTQQQPYQTQQTSQHVPPSYTVPNSNHPHPQTQPQTQAPAQDVLDPAHMIRGTGATSTSTSASTSSQSWYTQNDIHRRTQPQDTTISASTAPMNSLASAMYTAAPTSQGINAMSATDNLLASLAAPHPADQSIWGATIATGADFNNGYRVTPTGGTGTNMNTNMNTNMTMGMGTGIDQRGMHSGLGPPTTASATNISNAHAYGPTTTGGTKSSIADTASSWFSSFTDMFQQSSSSSSNYNSASNRRKKISHVVGNVRRNVNNVIQSNMHRFKHGPDSFTQQVQPMIVFMILMIPFFMGARGMLRGTLGSTKKTPANLYADWGLELPSVAQGLDSNDSFVDSALLLGNTTLMEQLRKSQAKNFSKEIDQGKWVYSNKAIPNQFTQIVGLTDKFPVERSQVSLIAACSNHFVHLSIALSSWLAVENLDEIVFVDWSTKATAVDLVKRLVRNSKVKVKVIWVPENRWVLSRAYNLAARFASGQRLLKVDCDTVLAPNFLSMHAMEQDSRMLYTSIEDAVLSGIFYMPREVFYEVNGFDERLTYYGYENIDLRRRILEQTESTLIPLDAEVVRHIPFEHPKLHIMAKSWNDSKFEFDEPVNDFANDKHGGILQLTNMQLFLNREGHGLLPPWKDASVNNLTTYQFYAPVEDSGGNSATSQADLLALTATTPGAMRDLVGPDRWEAIVARAIGVALTEKLDLPPTLSQALMKREDIMRDLADYTFNGNAAKPRVALVVIRGEHILDVLVSLTIASAYASSANRFALLAWEHDKGGTMESVYNTIDITETIRRFQKFSRQSSYFGVYGAYSCGEETIPSCVSQDDGWAGTFIHVPTNGEIPTAMIDPAKNLLLEFGNVLDFMPSIEQVPPAEFYFYSAMVLPGSTERLLFRNNAPGGGCLYLFDADEAKLPGLLRNWWEFREKVRKSDDVEIPNYRLFGTNESIVRSAAAQFSEISGKEALITEPSMLGDDVTWGSTLHDLVQLHHFQKCRGLAVDSRITSRVSFFIKYVLMWRKLNAPDLATDMLRTMSRISYDTHGFIAYEFKRW